MLSSWKGEYETIRECGAELIAISTDSLESHDRLWQTLEGLPFPLASDEGLEAARAYGVVGESGRQSNRAVFVIDQGGQLLHCIPWYQPGNIGQFMEVFEALGAV